MRRLIKYINGFFDLSQHPIDQVLFNLVIFSGIIGGATTCAVSMIFGMPKSQAVATVIGEIILILAFHISNFRGRQKLASVLIVITVADFFLPVIFLTGGGIKGGGPMWLLIGIVFHFLLVSGKTLYILLVLEAVVYSATFWIAYAMPERLEYMQSEEAVYFDIFQSLFIVAIIIGIIIKYQVAIFNKQIELNNEQKDNMTEMARVAELAKQKAVEADNSKSRFVTNISHEIRTPINSILGMDELIIRETGRDDIKDYALNIQNSGKLLLGIINDILDLSKLEAGTISIKDEVYDTEKFVSDIIDYLKTKTASKGLKAEINISNELPKKLIGDIERNKQILINLINNAVTYTNFGKIKLVIGCSISDDIATINCEVIDTGSGIKQEDMPKIFMAFERINEFRTKNVEGSGLGINITAQLLRLMGSELKVESEYGVGSKFYFECRQKIVDSSGIGDITNNRNKRILKKYSKSYTAPNANILVVDDNMMNRKVFVGLLKECKISVDEAESGQQSIEMVQKKHYDIIFMDHMMPNMDGIEAMKMIRALDNSMCDGTPIIMLTANTFENAREYFINQGFNDFIPKPIIPKNLENMIEEWLPEEMIITNEDTIVPSNRISIDELDGISSSSTDVHQSNNANVTYGHDVIIESKDKKNSFSMDFFKSMNDESGNVMITFDSQGVESRNAVAENHFADGFEKTHFKDDDSQTKSGGAKLDLSSFMNYQDDDDECSDTDVLPKIQGVDWEYARPFFPNIELLEETVIKFYTSIDTYVTQAKSYENLEQYRINVHSIKSSAAMIGAKDLSAVAKTLEYAARDGEIDKIKSMTDSFVSDLLDMKQKLRVFDK